MDRRANRRANSQSSLPGLATAARPGAPSIFVFYSPSRFPDLSSFRFSGSVVTLRPSPTIIPPFTMEAIIGFLIVVFIIWLIRAASRQSDDARAFRFSEIEPDPTGTPVTIRTKIRGVSHRNLDGTGRQKIIRNRCHEGDALLLLREPDNPLDRNAIQIRRIVCKQDKRVPGEQLGYVSRELAEELAPRLDSGTAMFAKITALTGDVTGTQKRSVGVNIEIQEYEPVPVAALPRDDQVARRISPSPAKASARRLRAGSRT